MKDLSFRGAYYIGLEDGETPDLRPVCLNGQEYEIGSRFQCLGNPLNKNRHFEMLPGWMLEFRGWFGSDILFHPWHKEKLPDATINTGQLSLFDSDRIVDIYYAFSYIDHRLLVLPGNRGCSDIHY